MAEIEKYTCGHCGRTYNRRRWQIMTCACQKVRSQRPDEAIADMLNVEQCVRIADHERMRTINRPMNESDVESLLEFDAIYEDDAAWNRRSRKCSANGVPDECRKRNPEGLWVGMPVKLKEYEVDPEDFEYNARSNTCRKCGAGIRNRRSESDASLCILCGRKMHRVIARQK